MKIFGLVPLLSVAILSGRNGVIGQDTGSFPRRTFMTIEYDYKLEVNSSQIEELGYNISTDTPLEDVLNAIDSNIVNTMQNKLPNGYVREGETIPDIKYNSVHSRFINMCYTESDHCKWVKSRIRLSFEGDRPKHAVERVSLGLVRDYLQDINDRYSIFKTMYVYPMIYSSSVRFQISPVDGAMNDSQIESFERDFYDVFQAIVSELDGDTEVSEAYFVYQDATELPSQEEESASKLSVDLKYYGKCRYCSEEELVETVDDSIRDNLSTFLRQLKATDNLVSYFEKAQDISVSKPVPSEGLPPVEDESLYDGKVRKASKKIPWALYSGIIAAIVVLGTGAYVIAKDQHELKKEDASTGNESSAQEEGEVEAHDSDSESDDDDDVECGGSIAENSVVSRDESTDSNGAHSNYEVYVY